MSTWNLRLSPIRLLSLALLGALSLAAAPSADAQTKRLTFEASEDDIIRGEVQKPSISLVVSRQNLSQDYTLELKRSFRDEIIKAAEKRPF